jgi:site-specific DNA recombinase
MSRNGEPTPVRCAIYVRKSSAKGLNGDLTSLDVQEHAARAHIESHAAEGWVPVANNYRDGGVSGGTIERLALQRLMRDIEAGKIDRVVVYRADRLSRSLRDFLDLLAFLDRHEVGLTSITETFDTKSPAGRLMLNLLASFGEYERSLARERTADRIAEAKRRGKWCGGVTPLGYAAEDGRLRPVDAEALRVEALFRICLDCRSLSETAREANRRGWTTKGHGGRFTKTTVNYLLRNPVYVGRTRHNGATYEGQHDPIVNESTWDETQRLLSSNGHKRSSASRSRDSQAWLRGLLWCRHCDAKMIHSTTRKGSRVYRYYTCGHAMREGWRNCPSPSVSAGDLERTVLAEIQSSIRGDADLLRATAREVHRQRKTRIAELKREVRIAELGRDSANGTGDINRRLVKLTTELAALSADRIADADVAQAVEAFEPLWAALTYAEQSQVATLLIERVVYDGDAVEIKFRESEMVRGDG